MAITKIWTKNYIDSVLTTATVTLSDSGGVYGIKNSAGTPVVAAGTAVPEVSTGVFEYGSSGSPLSAEAWYDTDDVFTYTFKIVQTGGDIDYITGTFGPAGGRIEFSEAYGDVRANVGNVLTLANTKRLINESLRILAEEEDWDWRKDSDVEVITTSDGIAQYELTLNVDQIIGAYMDDRHDMTIIDSINFPYVRFGNRISGKPDTLYVIGDNVVTPDPLPDDEYTINIIYRKLFHLTADSDEFPCKRNFVDAIVQRATWLGAEIVQKPGLAQTYRKMWEDSVSRLKRSRVNRGHLGFGDPGYSFVPAKKRRYR